jgi:hypothetical protein
MQLPYTFQSWLNNTVCNSLANNLSSYFTQRIIQFLTALPYHWKLLTPHTRVKLPAPIQHWQRGICLRGKVKVKFTLVQALRLCSGCMAHRGSRGIALPFLDHGTRRGVKGQYHALATLYPPPQKDPVPIVQGDGWAPGPVWTGVVNLAPTRIQSPDRPVRSQSLYRKSYPAHTCLRGTLQNLSFVSTSPDNFICC